MQSGGEKKGLWRINRVNKMQMLTNCVILRRPYGICDNPEFAVHSFPF